MESETVLLSNYLSNFEWAGTKGHIMLTSRLPPHTPNTQHAHTHNTTDHAEYSPKPEYRTTQRLRLRRIFPVNVIHGMVQERNTYLQTRQEEKDRQQIERWQGQESEARPGNCLQPDSAAVKWIPRWMEIYGNSKPPVKETPKELLRKAPPPPAAWCWECTPPPSQPLSLSRRMKKALIQLQEEAELDILESRVNVVELGQQRHGQKRFCFMTGGPHSDCKVKLATKKR